MRLIDADVLKQHIDKLPALPDGNFAGNHSALKALINMQPTVQPENAQLSQEGTTSDLISRQAARHALCKAVHNGEDVPCENQTASCLWTGTRVCDFVREIDALPTVQPEPQWIPCSERMPEPRIDVWVNSDLGQMVGYYDEMAELWYGRDYLELIVNAWMPLPTPYTK